MKQTADVHLLQCNRYFTACVLHLLLPSISVLQLILKLKAGWPCSASMIAWVCWTA